MRIAAAALALVTIVAYLGIPIDLKKQLIAVIAVVGLCAASFHILRYGRLLEEYVRSIKKHEEQASNNDQLFDATKVNGNDAA